MHKITTLVLPYSPAFTVLDGLQLPVLFCTVPRLEPHSSYDLPTPAWKAGVLPNKLMWRIRANPVGQPEFAMHLPVLALTNLLAVKHELSGIGAI